MSKNRNRIFLSPPHMSGKEMKYIQEAFSTNWIAPLGPNVDAFEGAISEYCGIEHVAALSSGTAAIHLALVLLGVASGDEVIVSTFTFSATVNPILYLGAKPVFIDSEPGTWNMDPELLRIAIIDRIKNGKKPKAIILVHLYGMPAQLDEIMDIANEFEIPLIEDAAEALGSRYNGKSVGTFGVMGVFSFNGNKILNTSGGGALVSDNVALISKARYLSTQARDNAPYYQHSAVGYNYRMSNILAGLGCGQMEVIEERISQRRSNFEHYKNAFGDLGMVDLLAEPDNRFFSNRWLSTLQIDRNTEFGWQTLQQELDSHNIESRPLWKPMHQQPVFKEYEAYLNNTSDELFRQGLCLPSGSQMKKDDLKRVVTVIKNTFVGCK